MTCEICFDYGKQTVSVFERGSNLEICFECMDNKWRACGACGEWNNGEHDCSEEVAV